MPIIADGRTDYQIIVPRRGLAAENEAALNLEEALLQMTGVRVPVRWGDRTIPANPRIFVGTREADEPGLWGQDSYSIRPDGEDLWLTGAFRRGVHYAVIAWLESLGVRFFAPGAIRYPRRRVIRLPKREVRSSSAFAYRHVFYPTAQEPEWALRWKLNVHNGADRRWGPNARTHSHGHSFQGLVPVRRHFEEHPEYFSLVDGSRRREQPQLCCTNPEVAEVASETMARWIEANPDRRIFAVGQNDWQNYCECPACRAVDEAEGGPTGQLLTLVNRVAERFPDRIIATLSYDWSLEPPRQMHARDNVLIVLCHNRGCFTHGLEACEHNHLFLDRLKRWKQRAAHIMIWDYYVNYHSYLLPTPNFRRIGEDLRTYRDVGIHGMFCQGSACRGGQFEHLRAYVQSRLLWQPDQDVETLMAEWCRGVYGPAGEHVLEYLHLLENKVHRDDVHMLRFAMTRQFDLYTPEILEQGKAIWDRAEAAAKTRKQKRRVFGARCSEMLARLAHAPLEYRLEGDVLRLRPNPDLELRDRFVDAALDRGASAMREDEGAPEDFRINYGREYRAVVLESDALKAVILPEMGGRIYSLQYKPLSLELLAVPTIFQSVHLAPYSGGYDFTLAPRRLGRGAVEEYGVAAEDGRETVMEAVLGDGLTIRTKYIIEGACLRALHEVSNEGADPVEIAPVCNPEWTLDAFGPDARLALPLPDGSESADPINPEGRRQRDLTWAESACPAGAWRLESARHDLSVTATFPVESADHTRMQLQHGSLKLQHCFRPVTLASGESARFESAWEFRQGT